jgi:hypothetical protein
MQDKFIEDNKLKCFNSPILLSISSKFLVSKPILIVNIHTLKRFRQKYEKSFKGNIKKYIKPKKAPNQMKKS